MQAATDISTLAGEAYGQFERRTRRDADETSYTTLKDDAPQWLHELVREAHGDMLPDDWRYECIHDALSAIEDGDEDGDEFANAVDNADLFRWVSSYSRWSYCDEAQEEGLAAEGASVTELVSLGQYMERREVFASVIQSLAERLEALAES